MLDEHLRFQANDELLLINAIAQTELTAKKAALYAGLAQDNGVREFFQTRAMIMKKVADDLRKQLDKVGGS